jgi:hypothetical protein
MNLRAQRACVWAGPLFGICFLLGAVVLGRWIPPYVNPRDHPLDVAHVLAAHATRIRIGALLACIGSTLVAPWGLVIAAQIRPLEGRFPIVTYLLVVCAELATVALMIAFCIWGTAVFRPLATDPKITQALNDLGYITFLFTAPPFSPWAAALAFAVLHDHGARPVYPRWLGYLSAWVAVLIFPAGLVIFFKTGPFAWSGLMALYVPAAAFFAWLVAITWCTLQNLAAGLHDRNPPLRDSAAVVIQ